MKNLFLLIAYGAVIVVFAMLCQMLLIHRRYLPVLHQEYYYQYEDLQPGTNSSTSKISTTSSTQLLTHQYKDSKSENRTISVLEEVSPGVLASTTSTITNNMVNKKSSSNTTSASVSNSSTSTTRSNGPVPSHRHRPPTSTTAKRMNDTAEVLRGNEGKEAAPPPSTAMTSCQTLEHDRRFRLKTEGGTEQKYLTTSSSCGNGGNDQHFHLSDLMVGSERSRQIFKQNSDGMIEGLGCYGKVIEIPADVDHHAGRGACESENDEISLSWQNTSVMGHQQWCIDESLNQFINKQCTTFALKVQQRRLEFEVLDELNDPTIPNKIVHSRSIFVRCMLQAESEILNPMNLERWDKDMVPIPYSVKIINGAYNILTHLVQDQRSKLLRYTCNGLSGATVDKDIHFKEFMVIQCPTTLDPTVTDLLTYSGINATSNETVFTQNVGRLAKCEKADIQQMQEINEKKHIKIGASCALHFRVQNIGLVMEWAAYHHAIGVDHIWIYVNRDWRDGQYLPQKDYITWVPWNFHMPVMSRERRYREFKFQMQSMNDALWRAKRMDMDWIALIDLDEYIVIHGGEKDVSLQKYFETLDNSIQGYAAIRMNSIPFGLGRDEKGTFNATKKLLIDYVYRMDVDMEQHIRDREKLFLNPRNAKALDTHYLRSGPNRRIYWEKSNILRINHYKNPFKGVFRAGNQNLTVDSTLMDGFHDVVVREIENKKQQIPKILHFVYVSPHIGSVSNQHNEIPELVNRSIDDWRSLHSEDWKVIVWDDVAIQNEFPELIPTLGKISTMAWIADLIRYHVLERYGGIYLDTDIEGIQPLDTFLSYQAFTVCERPFIKLHTVNQQPHPIEMEEGKCKQACTAVIGSVPHHDALQAAIKLSMANTVKALDRNIKKFNIGISGPPVWHQAAGVNNVTFLQTYTFFPCHFYAPKETCFRKNFVDNKLVFATHLWAKSWI